MERKPRIALLIDADNVSRDGVEQALANLSTVGDASIRRAYGDWFDTRLKRWEPLLRSARIRSVQQFGYTKGKNATDMALTIDAVSLLFTERPDGFAIVSSDADFTPLVMHLREHGVDVYGYGSPKTPKPFRDACTTFVALTAAEKAAAVPEVKRAEDATALLTKAVRAKADKTGWARVQAIRQAVGAKSAFDPKTYGSATLSKLLVATGRFEIRNEGTPAAAVREKAGG